MKYRIFIDDNLFYSSDGRPTGGHVVYNPKLDQSWGSATLSFSLNEDLDISPKTVVRVYRDDTEIFRGRPISSSGTFRKQTTIKCENDLNFFRDSIQTYETYEDVTPATIIADVINKHNPQVDDYKKFKFGKCEINPHIYLDVNFDTSLAFMTKIAEECDGYFSTRKGTDGYYLDFLSYNGRKTAAQTVEIGENLLDFVKKKNVQQLYSIILPLGYKMSSSDKDDMRLDIREVNNGSYTLESPDMVNLVGKITRKVIYDEIYEDTELKSQAQKDLTNQLTDITLEVSFLDLHIINDDISAFDVGDQIRVISPPHNLDRYFVLSKASLDLQNPENSKLTLGRSVSRKLSDAVQTNADMSMVIRNNAVTKNDVVQSSKDALNKMFNTDGEGSNILFDTDETGRVQQIIAMDSMDETLAQKKLVLNKNGLAGSSDGGQTFSAAITTDGWIYGDRIIAGTITASKIDVSYTEAQDQKWKDELDNSYLTSSQTRTAIKNSADEVLISAEQTMQSELQNYYTKAQISTTVNEINLTVSQKVGSNEIISKINQSPEKIKISANKVEIDAESFRIQATELSWKCNKSEMTSKGELTAWKMNALEGIEVWADNVNTEPYIDFHTSPKTSSSPDYNARLSVEDSVFKMKKSSGKYIPLYAGSVISSSNMKCTYIDTTSTSSNDFSGVINANRGLNASSLTVNGNTYLNANTTIDGSLTVAARLNISSSSYLYVGSQYGRDATVRLLTDEGGGFQGSRTLKFVNGILVSA